MEQNKHLFHQLSKMKLHSPPDFFLGSLNRTKQTFKVCLLFLLETSCDINSNWENKLVASLKFT
jgi:hypothetical protein